MIQYRYLSRSNIYMFPTDDELLHLNNTIKYNLTSTINKLIDVDSFIISNDIKPFSENRIKVEFLEFNIAGYYFKIKFKDLIDLDIHHTYDNLNHIHAKIKLKLETNHIDSNELLRFEDLDNDNFTKLQFYSSSELFSGVYIQNYENCTIRTYDLSILTYDNVSKLFKVPIHSKISFRTPELSIDDGQI